MQTLSTLPYLCVGLAGFWITLGFISFKRRVINAAGLASIVSWIACLAAWGAASAYLAVNGYYASAGFLTLLPGLWWPLIPAFITATLLVLPPFRRALLVIVSQNTRALVFIQALRIAAVGGVIKGIGGLLPASFALAVGIPDMIFGLSALALAVLWPKEGWSKQSLLIWNLIGIGVIMPAPVLMQLGLPGVLHFFTSAPNALVLFEFPMVLAPTVVVPLFITMNAIHAAALWNNPPSHWRGVSAS